MKLKSKVPQQRFDPRRDGVSQSILATWLECREMARLGTIIGLDGIGVPAPLGFGALGHSALHKCYITKHKTVRSMIQGVNEQLAFAKKEFCKERDPMTSDTLDMMNHSLIMLEKLLPAYYSHWGESDLKKDWTRIEEKFRIEMKMPDGAVVPYVGKMDGTFSGKKQVHLFETKFKSQFSSNLSDTLPMDTQIGAYVTALKVIDKSDPGSITYNMIRRSKMEVKQGESLADLAMRMGAEAMKKPDHFFQRLEITLTREEKEEHAFRLQKLVEEFYAWWKVTTTETRDLMWNGARCDQYGGCRFLAVCSRGDRSAFRIKERVHPEL